MTQNSQELLNHSHHSKADTEIVRRYETSANSVLWWISHSASVNQSMAEDQSDSAARLAFGFRNSFLSNCAKWFKFRMWHCKAFFLPRDVMTELWVMELSVICAYSENSIYWMCYCCTVTIVFMLHHRNVVSDQASFAANFLKSCSHMISGFVIVWSCDPA